MAVLIGRHGQHIKNLTKIQAFKLKLLNNKTLRIPFSNKKNIFYTEFVLISGFWLFVYEYLYAHAIFQLYSSFINKEETYTIKITPT